MDRDYEGSNADNGKREANISKNYTRHLNIAGNLTRGFKMQVTKLQLDKKIDSINATLGTPLSPWTSTKADGINANIGCIFLDSAYGGYSIRRMCKSGGEEAVIVGGYYSKREIMLQLEAYHVGIKAGRENPAP